MEHLFGNNIRDTIKIFKGVKREDMLVRYCDTRLHREFSPCQVGWGSMNSEGCKSCYDSPAKENCRNLVDPQNLHCPYCGGWIENPFADCMGISKDDYRIIKD